MPDSQPAPGLQSTAPHPPVAGKTLVAKECKEEDEDMAKECKEEDEKEDMKGEQGEQRRMYIK